MEDAHLAGLLAASPEDDWGNVTERALAVGARGLLNMGVGVDVGRVRDEIRAEMQTSLKSAEESLRRVLAEVEQAMAAKLDPDLRSSFVAQTISEFQAWGEGIFLGLDPEYRGSRASRLMAELDRIVGPAGTMEQRLLGVLEGDGSALVGLRQELQDGLQQLRDLINRDHGIAAEAERGTRKGFDWEDQVESLVRAWAAGLGGCTVERTGATGGTLGRDCFTGDIVLTLDNGDRIVFEAKNKSRLSLTGNDGILGELDRALDNREGDFAVCISANDAFPRETGRFGVYGNRILVVDEGDGVLLGAAIRWAVAALGNRPDAGANEVDAEAIVEGVERIRRTAKRFAAVKKGLTEMQAALDAAKGSLDELRGEILVSADEIAGGFEAA
jgi:hypothetical protein